MECRRIKLLAFSWNYSYNGAFISGCGGDHTWCKVTVIFGFVEQHGIEYAVEKRASRYPYWFLTQNMILHSPIEWKRKSRLEKFYELRRICNRTHLSSLFLFCPNGIYCRKCYQVVQAFLYHLYEQWTFRRPMFMPYFMFLIYILNLLIQLL